MRNKIKAAIAAIAISVSGVTWASAQTLVTQLVPVNVQVVNQAPAGTPDPTVRATCYNLNDTTGAQQQLARFAGDGKTTWLFAIGPKTACSFDAPVVRNVVPVFTVGGVVRPTTVDSLPGYPNAYTANLPVTQTTDVVVTYTYPLLTVKLDAPANVYGLTLNCNVPFTPAVFNGNFTLTGGQDRKFTLADIPSLTTGSVCEARLLDAQGAAHGYQSTVGTTVVNGVTLTNTLNGVTVDGVFRSALTQTNGQKITITVVAPVVPTTVTVPSTTTTTTTQPTTTQAPVVTTATTTTTTPATTALPVVNADPAIAVVADATFTG